MDREQRRARQQRQNLRTRQKQEEKIDLDLDYIDLELEKEIEESFNSNDSIFDFKTIFNPKLNLPFWKTKEGDHCFDIIQYIGGKNKPPLAIGAEEGKIAYKLEVHVHNLYAIGVSYLCLKRCYDEPDPICEYVTKLRRDWEENKDLIKKYQAQRRVIYNIICRDNEKEEKKGIQIWNVSYHYMEEKIKYISKKHTGLGFQSKVDRFIPFPSIRNGRLVCFHQEGVGETTRFYGHKFEERQYKLSPDLIKQAYHLDELLYKPGYEEMERDLKLVLDGKIDDSDLDNDSGNEEFIDQEEFIEEKEQDSNQVVCPQKDNGGIFGETTDLFDQCPECKYYVNCGEVYDSKVEV